MADISKLINLVLSVKKQELSDKEKKRALWVKPKKPTKEIADVLSYIMPPFNTAIKKAENDKRRFGVRSIKTNSPEEANKILDDSVRNNFLRWMEAGRPDKFVDFMRDRWAPLDAENDPEKLNYNWAPNVRSILNSILGKKTYKDWEKMDIVDVLPYKGQPIPWANRDSKSLNRAINSGGYRTPRGIIYPTIQEYSPMRDLESQGYQRELIRRMMEDISNRIVV